MVQSLEASNLNDEKLIRDVTNFYSFGVGTGTLKDLKAVPKEKRTEVLQGLNEKGPSDMGDLFNRLHLKGAWVEPWEKQAGSTIGGFKTRKVLNIRAMREENEKVKRCMFVL